MAKGGLMYKNDYFKAGLYNSYFGKPTQVNYILENVKKSGIISTIYIFIWMECYFLYFCGKV